MPYVVNGIGTWYYGKRRMHRFKADCGFCHRHGELASYDTTLFFVVFFVPIAPLGQKRIIEECPTCRRHRLLPLRKWEEAKARSLQEVLDKLNENPDDRANVLAALQMASSFQDETLFDQLATALAKHRYDDAVIQSQLASAYGYFGRWAEAETAWKAARALDDSQEIREQLALTIMRQGRPEEAAPLIDHILTGQLEDRAGNVYVLVSAYQAQGMHHEALALMDRRDAAFPRLTGLKDYKNQRKISERYRDTQKRIASPFLSESGKIGYHEGGWTSRLPRLVPLFLLVLALAAYLGSAIWLGQAREVYVVNGSPAPYTVVINGKVEKLKPGVTPLRVGEGDLNIELRDTPLPLAPVTAHIETPFWSRPFVRHTIVVNPDQTAMLTWQQTIYSDAPRPPDPEPPRFHLGEAVYSFNGIDYEFTAFPPSLQANTGTTMAKTRVDIMRDLTPESRLFAVREHLNAPDQQAAFVKRLAALEPDNLLVLGFLAQQLKPDETIQFLKQGLDKRPLWVDWHRAYQSLMERTRRDEDLRPEYRRIVKETGENPDAVYLLGRIEDLDTADKLYRQAASADPPSRFAFQGLGFRALASGDFAEAVTWLEQASKLAPADVLVQKFYREALLAAGRYDRLLDVAQSGAVSARDNFSGYIVAVRVHANRKDKQRLAETIEQGVRSVGDPEAAMPNQLPGQARQESDAQRLVRSLLEMIACCQQNDEAAYLQLMGRTKEIRGFPTSLVEGKLDEAAELISKEDNDNSMPQHGMLYLAAVAKKNDKLAAEQWTRLLACLDKSDRDPRRFGLILAGKEPVNPALMKRLPIEPMQKRVLLAVAAQRFPEHAKEFQALARALDIEKDALSLCLNKLLK